MKAKYTLFSGEGGQPAPCAFFASPEGCRNGSKCKFLHGEESNRSKPLIKRDRSHSVVSSESESSSPPSFASRSPGNQMAEDKQQISSEKKSRMTPVILEQANSEAGKNRDKTTPNKTKSEKKKKNRRSGESDIFAMPKGKDSSRPAKKARKVEKEIIQAPLPRPPSLENPPPSAKKAPYKNRGQNATPDFRNLNLPIAAFSIPGFEPKKGSETSDSSVHSSVKADHPLPKSTEIGRKWMDGVTKTRAHLRYATSYDFKRMMEQDEANGIANPSDWIKPKPYGDWCKNNPQAIAVDCEMCQTKDPLTGSLDHKSLCRISVVNAEKPYEVLLDTLVKPSWPVTDHRTWVNGIKKEHLEDVQFTVRHAQAFMMALCSEETVIIGHAVHNDLAAMRMEHHCIVDSANLFSVKDEPERTPSLKDVCIAILKEDMPDTHDSVNDAKVSLRCLEVWLEEKGNVEQVERTPKLVKNKNAASQLFIHRVPKFCQQDHLSTLFLNHASIQAEKVDEIEFNGDFGKTLVTFTSARHANLAFSALEGEEDPDSSGRLQKKIFLRDGGYIRVRKMVHERNQYQEAKRKSF